MHKTRAFRLFVTIVMYLTLIATSGCGNSEDAKDSTLIIDITPDFSDASPMSSDPNFRNTLLDSPDRCKLYTTTCYNYGNGFRPNYVSEYQCISDAQMFLQYSAYLTGSPKILDFYWYGYEASNIEKIILNIDPTLKNDHSLFTVTSSYARHEAVIYESCPLTVIGDYAVDVSPNYQTTYFTRDQFEEAITNGELPETMVRYDTLADADYICKASIQVTFSRNH